MSSKEPTREEALRRLSERADALQRTSEASKPASAAVGAGGSAVSQAYRIVVELFAGVIVGLGLGFGVDRLLHTAPWGLIGGVLVGFGVSVWMAKRTADRLVTQAKAEEAARGGPPPSVPTVEGERD